MQQTRSDQVQSGTGAETTPRVSVITPVRNAAKTLPQTVASIQAQTVADWEVLLIDDASDDGSWTIAQDLAGQDPRVRTLQLESHGGAAMARNAGIRAARGRFIAFLDADDLWRPQKLAKQLPLLEDGAGFVFSSYLRRGATGTERIAHAPSQVTYEQALRGNPIGCLTAIYDSDIYGRAEMPLLTRRQDYALWLDLLKRGHPAIGVPDVLAEYRVRPDSLSSNKLAAARATWTVLRGQQGLSLPKAARCFSHYAWRALRDRS